MYTVYKLQSCSGRSVITTNYLIKSSFLCSLESENIQLGGLYFHLQSKADQFVCVAIF